MEIKHEEHKKKGVFYIDEDGERLAELEYFDSAPGEITIHHTGVNEKLRGQKVGDKLVAAAVSFAREKGLKIVPICPFTQKVIDRTPEFQDILA
ncbi:GNAT family N-acetyltransferase [soil metagenome]